MSKAYFLLFLWFLFANRQSADSQASPSTLGGALPRPRVNRTCPEIVDRNCSYTVRVSYINCPPGVNPFQFFSRCVKYRNEIQHRPCKVLDRPCCKGYVLGPDNYCQRPNAPEPASGCGGSRSLRNSSGIISTPNYPNHYAHNLSCTWTIETPPSQVAIVKILDLDTESLRGLCDERLSACVPQCDFDFLELRKSGHRHTNTFCGNNPPRNELLYTQGTLNISFTSDASIQGRGFKLIYSVLSTIDLIPRGRCTGGQKWRLCRRVCRLTCDDASAPDRPPSTTCLQHDGTNVQIDVTQRDDITCVPSCTCPTEKPIWHQGRCVKLESCPRRSFMCGAPITRPTRKILGGGVAGDGSWPWMVQIAKNNHLSDCAGALICSDWVITAAHCLVDQNTWRTPGAINVNWFWFHLGKYWKYDQEDGRRVESYRASRIIIHPSYNFTHDLNDLALVKLAGYARQWDRIRPICIPPPLPDYIQSEEVWIRTGGFPGIGTRCIAIGWGANRDIGPSPTILKQASLPIRPASRCPYNHFNWRTTICAGGLTNADTCQGDSGGPYMCQLSNGLWYIYGVTSFGKTCGTGTPGGYTRVSHFVNWIREIIGNQCEK